MAPANPLASASLYVHYTSGPYGHEMEFRFDPGTSPAAAAETAHGICEVMAVLVRTDDNFDSARFRAANTSFSFPTPWNSIPGAANNNLGAGDPESRFVSWVARDSGTGRRSRFTLFTASSGVPIPANNRFASTDVVAVDDALNALQAAAAGTGGVVPIVGITLGELVFNEYTNSGWNSHFQRKQRPR
jgi:hypothetical protein